HLHTLLDLVRPTHYRVQPTLAGQRRQVPAVPVQGGGAALWPGGGRRTALARRLLQRLRSHPPRSQPRPGGGIRAQGQRQQDVLWAQVRRAERDRKSTRLNSSHVKISY